MAEVHIASTREGVPTDGVNKVGKNITISLIFKSENNLARFQSEVIELMSVVAGHKRPHIEVDEATVPHELVLWREQTECISVDSVKLSRVFKYQYQHDSTADDPDNSAENRYRSAYLRARPVLSRCQQGSCVSELEGGPDGESMDCKEFGDVRG